MEQDQIARLRKNVAALLTDRLIEAWKNFMEEFQQSFDFNQLDPVLSLLRELDCASQNPTKKKRFQFVQKRDGESENNNDNSSSLEKKVLGNHLLANSVFKYLPHSDLLSCRLINSYWNEYSTEILLKSDFKIEFGTRGNRFYLRESNWKSLDMFTELLRTSKQFPCNKFEFYGGNLGNDDAQRFFFFNGPNIKYLKITFSDGKVYNKDVVGKEAGFSPYLTDSRVIGVILTQNLPNLEELELDLRRQGNYKWSGHKSLFFPPKKEVNLPNLKKLVYDSYRHGDDPILRQLLVAATNLERFEFKDYFLDMVCLDDFTKTGKVKCISDLDFATDAEELNKLEEMLKHELKLADLCLENLIKFYDQPETWKRISIILTNLFESSKKSLKISDFRSLGFLRQLQLPVLENMTKLNLDRFINESHFNDEDVHDYSFAVLPRGATFSKNFPRLNSVELHFEISTDDAAALWTKYFPTEEIVPTVKKLKVCDSCPVLWMQKMSKMFPNLDELSVCPIKDFPHFSKILWTLCRKLKSLEIGIDMNSPLNSHPALDSSFTGLSPEVCKKLETFSLPLLESVAGSYMENQPSILDMTDLRSLHINLHFYMSLENYKYQPILTPLTGICVFRPLEKLREVNIKCSTLNDQQLNESSILKNLAPLTPYKVKIEVK